MKEISIDQPFARGRTADLHEWENGTVLKLFHNWFSLEDIQYEQRIARAVHASGVKTPAVREIVQTHGRNGLIYERVTGISMLEMFQKKPWQVLQLGKMLAELHAQMHACIFDADVPLQRWKLQNKIKDAKALPVYLKPKLLDSLESLPDGDRVCHGDFHPANVLVSENDSTIIDWIDASRGNPLADVARTSIITLGAAASSQIPNAMLKVFVKVFHSAYLNHYFRLRPGGEDEYLRWLPVVAGARLNENIPEVEAWLVKEAGRI